jgi:hypothetical protein
MPPISDKTTTAFWAGFAKSAALSRALRLSRKGLTEQQLIGLFAKEAPQQYVQRRKQREKRAAADKIPGGLADHIPRSAFNPAAMKAGQKVELEHTSSRAIAEEIARDHLTEDPRYYDKLKKMEKGANP